MKYAIRILIAISAIAQCTFLYFFVQRNAPGLSSPMVVTIMGCIYASVFVLTSLWGLRTLGERRPADPGSVLAASVLYIAICAGLLWIFLDAAVLDYYQPLSLFDDAIAALSVSWSTLILALLLTLVGAKGFSLSHLRACVALGLVALLGWPLAASLKLVNKPVFGEAVVTVQDIFTGGEQGYAIYRIPALITLPAGSSLASGTTLASDRLLAFAEARRDGSLDTGVIDLVLRYSDDQGQSWSPQQVVCRHEISGLRGKCGNATPLYDVGAGQVVLGYNLSGISDGEAGGRHHSTHVTISPDGGISWQPPVRVADDNFVLGPGHGIQKTHAPARGRLLLPGYVDTHALVLYSDDNGTNWQRSEALNTGNETELAELSNGDIYLTTRHRAPIGRPPEPNGRLFSISSDGGKQWSETATDTALVTPICQASVLAYENELLLFSNPAHPKSRVNMEIKVSKDGGSTWNRRIPVFSGPAGYSQLAQNSAGDVFVLFESGTMAYSERISLARIPASAL
jgi:sialidase-1